MNRRELVRAYKETRRPMGVYRIRNVRDGRSVVGTSVDLPAILNRERVSLRFGMHRNTALQRDWNALGPDAFAFEVLDTLSPPDDQPGYDPGEDLKVLLALWLERLAPFDDEGYMRRPAR
jgi:hypothetical protein